MGKFMPGPDCFALVALSGNSKRSAVDFTIARCRFDRRSHGYLSKARLYRSSAAMLTCGIAAGLLGWATPYAASAKDSEEKDLPPIVVVDSAKKPQRQVATR